MNSSIPFLLSLLCTTLLLSSCATVSQEKWADLSSTSMDQEPAIPSPAAPTRTLYVNPGDTTAGFVLKHGSRGAVNLTIHDHTLVGNYGGKTNRGWWALPVYVQGDFQIDFDVFPDANDAASFLILFDDATNKGINVGNSTNTSVGDHSLFISSVGDLTNHDPLSHPYTILARGDATNFPDQAWTHVTITKTGDILTDDVGGQILSCAPPAKDFPANAHIGLGYYATKNGGGRGRVSFAHIRIVETNPP